MSKPKPKITTAQIGQCGVFLLQYELLLSGVESAAMTTDYGIDLVAYSPTKRNAVTIQVKAKLKPAPGGGRGRMALGWRIPAESPAQYAAFVDLRSKNIWIFSLREIAECAQQHTPKGDQLYFYIDDDVKTRTGKPGHMSEFEKFRLPNRMSEIFEV